MRDKNQVIEAIIGRHPAERFSQRELPEGVLVDLLTAANCAPSPMNLQPWQFIVVRDPVLKRMLSHCAPGKESISEAPVIAVFLGDTRAWKKPYRQILKESVQAQYMDEDEAEALRKRVAQMFALGPLGLKGFLNQLTDALKRIKTPLATPFVTSTDVASYMKAQALVSATVFVLAAEGCGLGARVIDRFDEYRVRKLLRIPRRLSLAALVAVGWRVEGDESIGEFRLPLAQKVSVDQWGEQGIKASPKSRSKTD